MEYVMVPVPEELVEEVKLFVQWEAGKQPPLENPPLLKDLVASTDQQAQAVLRYVAEASQDQIRPSLTEISTEFDLSIREIYGLVTQINNLSFRKGGPMAVVMIRPDGRAKPDDRDEFHHRVVMMADEIAELILGT
ncbi:MAG: hypothetical protein ACI9C1_000934 [Candidatus Aldehydirespiratoraceae bacterium]|jgi:hypothetical protein